MEGSTAMYTTLDNLSESDFKRFREYLSRDVKKGFKLIPWGKLEKADVTDTVRLMRNSYGDQGSSELTRDILETMGCLGIASRSSEGTQNVEDLARGHSETDGAAKSAKMTTKTGTTADVTNQQLMKLAKCMGKEWKQVGIGYLGVSEQELDKIQESQHDVDMQRYCMLDKWRRQNKGKAGVGELHVCLNKNDLPTDVRDCLEEMLNNCGN